MNIRITNTIKILMVFLVVGTTQLHASLRDLYTTVEEATYDQVLKTTPRNQHYQLPGRLLSQAISKRATEIFNTLEGEQQKQVAELNRVTAQLQAETKRADEQARRAKEQENVVKERNINIENLKAQLAGEHKEVCVTQATVTRIEQAKKTAEQNNIKLKNHIAELEAAVTAYEKVVADATQQAENLRKYAEQIEKETTES